MYAYPVGRETTVLNVSVFYTKINKNKICFDLNIIFYGILIVAFVKKRCVSLIKIGLIHFSIEISCYKNRFFFCCVPIHFLFDICLRKSVDNKNVLCEIMICL